MLVINSAKHPVKLTVTFLFFISLQKVGLLFVVIKWRFGKGHI